ncbi:Probable lipoprotein precursor [Tenacibaculum maritimum]|nr:hypothetical protein [Tenacibaculum maritimum]CAA0167933.1 Probable lipoprotein precursor [Tenacibaculum maritimum]
MNILNNLRKPYFAILLATLILFVSCSQYDDTIPENIETNRITGKELFKGIFFSEGNVSQRLSNFQDFKKLKSQFTSEQKTSFLNFQNNLIAQIDKSNPEYFTNLENAIYTGNRVIIRNELNNSKGIIKEAIQTLTSFDYDEIEKQISQKKSSLVVNLDEIQDLKSRQFLKNYQPNYQAKEACLAVWAVAVVVAAALWVAVYVDVVYWSSARSTNTAVRLEQENFINSIAELNVIK